MTCTHRAKRWQHATLGVALMATLQCHCGHEDESPERSKSLASPTAPAAPASATSPRPAAAPPIAPIGQPLTQVVGQEVDFVVYKRPSEENQASVGDVAKVRVEVGPNPTQEPRVSADGDLSDGAGLQWRATAYMAAVLAATSLNKQLSDYHFSVFARGAIDGPSGGALVAATFLALLTKQDIRSDVAITGALNPDGSVAPVGGLPQKLTAAKRKGKILFGYPKGQQRVADENQCTKDEKQQRKCQTVDVQELARQHSIEAREIADIYDAYELLTGKRLQYAEPLDRTAMDLDRDDRRILSGLTERWLAKSEGIFTKTIQKKGPQYPGLTPWVETARKHHLAAKSYFDLGLVPPAYSKARQAASDMMMIALTIEVLESRDLAHIGNHLANLQSVRRHWQAFKDQLDSGRPPSLTAALNQIQAYALLTNSHAHMERANRWLEAIQHAIDQKKLKMTPGDLVPNLMRPMRDYAMADILVDMARDLPTLPSSRSAPFSASETELSRLAMDYTSVADANHTYYHSLPAISDKIELKKATDNTEAHQVHDSARAYAISHRGDTGYPAALMNLGAAISAHLGFSLLGVREYALNAPNKTVLQTEFSRVLDRADHRTLEEARWVRDITGSVPLSMTIAYQLARSGREDDDPESKFEALQNLWEASTLARLAVVMSRLGAPPTPSAVRAK